MLVLPPVIEDGEDCFERMRGIVGMAADYDNFQCYPYLDLWPRLGRSWTALGAFLEFMDAIFEGLATIHAFSNWLFLEFVDADLRGPWLNGTASGPSQLGVPIKQWAFAPAAGAQARREDTESEAVQTHGAFDIRFFIRR